jgi:Pin2-interacting protein X1
MGLAGERVKQRFGYDPRNTRWANDTDRFGHQYLEKMGWKPGSGLGQVTHAVTTHVRVALKDDTVGLGAKLSKKVKKDEFDSGECAGLDVFQRILGRLNGKEEEISKELELQRKEKILNGKLGVQFVKGDTLKSTWDTEKRRLMGGKRGREDEDSDSASSEDEEMSKKSKRGEKEKKKQKKEKKEGKKGKKSKSDDKEKRGKKEKKDKKKKHKEEVTRESMLKPNEARKESLSVNTRLSVRSKWIRQKRAATMDAKALNEIFMISNS